MVMFLPVTGGSILGGGASAGSIGAAGSSNGTATFPGMGSGGGWEYDDMSMPSSGGPRTRSNGGFDYQGKPYDPSLHEPMLVNVETHGDFWEDDMDHSESVSYENVDTHVGVQSKTDEKSCENCPPEGKVMPMVRRCSRWSMVTISYQTRICGTFYNPETQQIQEFKYCGVSFDGWKDKLCQFWEAKARYDQFFDAFGDPKGWWKGYKSGLSQAARHQAVATVNQPLKVVWVFMQPVSYRYFSKMFKDFKDIITRWVP
ncbi:Tox-REase-5 domain-containing protein [Yersinia intermedia]|uniref:Tox-REase-5 domain-containing protein n=1 Tax=Yersinia intermedia TaxID=631 RepID=UPI001CFF4C76|nr:Tox-REase-5 domain-containing protein [Yersinia intermedia]MCB5321028.1 restriction endonuclease fold toxin 5 domain-containing protein [Yersinia intermedia]UNK21965.1 restriction endonuclease fold toxin 5 domain-containing protein [Yersinia intermedia]UZM69619.1 restriction endonuclease fold toxin 5 domain-containing protein [Yersinia intermedia]